MKRTFALALLAGGLFARPLPVHAEPTISVGSATAAPGAVASVPLTLNGDFQNVTGVEIHLDHSAVTPAGGPALTVAALDTKALPVKLADATFDSNDLGGAFHAAIVKADPFDGPLTVATLQVQVPAGAAPGAVYTLSLTATVTDPDGKPLPAKIEGGTLTVTGGTVKKGDVNGDGGVDVGDAVLCLRSIVGLDTLTAAQTAAADFSADGAVTVEDVVLLLQAIVGIGQ